MSPDPTPRSATSWSGPLTSPLRRTTPMRIAVAGAGAFGIKHLDGLALIDGVTVTSLISGRLEQAEEVARKYGIGYATTDLDEVLARDDVDAVILCTPTQLHAQQAIAAMRAGKHVQVEIPLADSWADAERVDRVQQETGLGATGGARRTPAGAPGWAPPAGSTRRTSGSTGGSARASCPSSRWTCRPTSSAGPT